MFSSSILSILVINSFTVLLFIILFSSVLKRVDSGLSILPSMDSRAFCMFENWLFSSCMLSCLGVVVGAMLGGWGEIFVVGIGCCEVLSEVR